MSHSVFSYIKWFFIVLLFISCKKDWLDIKPAKEALVPETLSDYQALLDNYNTCHVTTIVGELGGDNLFIAPATLISQSTLTITGYTWAHNGWEDNISVPDWSTPYQAVLYANLTMEGLNKIPKTNHNSALWNNVFGTALFLRGSSFFNLASSFAKPFAKNSPNNGLGIPLRLESDANSEVGRATIKETYDQIIKDIKSSIDYLPSTSRYLIRPTKLAAHAMLARIYLMMQEYDSALVYSNLVLQQPHSLLDFKLLSPSGSVSMPTPENNPEVIYNSKLIPTNGLNQSRADVDSNLFNSYEPNDLRKVLFFRNSGSRKVWAGSYLSSTSQHFSGLAFDEMYLIRGECLARKGEREAALADLNTLLMNRFDNTFIPVELSTNDETLMRILQERRKELLWRGLRWSDLRRLNTDTNTSTTLVRYYNGDTLTLVPGDNKYVWPIPDNEILYSGIQQNPR